jgi:hypothetical protein
MSEQWLTSRKGNEYGKRREVANLEAFRRAEEADLHALQAGKNRMRSHITMEPSTTSFERGVVDACRGQHAEHRKEANGDTPSLVTRIRSWF